MGNKAGILLAFTLGLVVAYKWPVIRKALAPLSSKVEKPVIKGYLAVKEGMSAYSTHLRDVTRELTDKIAIEARS